MQNLLYFLNKILCRHEECRTITEMAMHSTDVTTETGPVVLHPKCFNKILAK